MIDRVSITINRSVAIYMNMLHVYTRASDRLPDYLAHPNHRHYASMRLETKEPTTIFIIIIVMIFFLNVSCMPSMS